MTINDIKNQFIEKYKNKEFIVNSKGDKTIEIIDAVFDA